MIGTVGHTGWCNTNQSDDARGSMAVDRSTCDCGAAARDCGNWMPNRDKATEATGWSRFIERLGLDHWPETERYMLRGQDGWAFTAATRFQQAASDLAETDERYYWSSYHLLALIIEQARTDLVFLEAIEALAVAHLYGGLSKTDVTRQLKQMGVWP